MPKKKSQKQTTTNKASGSGRARSSSNSKPPTEQEERALEEFENYLNRKIIKSIVSGPKHRLVDDEFISTDSEMYHDFVEVHDYSDCDDDDDDDFDDYDDSRVFLRYDPTELSGGSGPPQNGHDYLKQVQEERSRLPASVGVRPTDRQANLEATQRNGTSHAGSLTEADIEAMARLRTEDSYVEQEILGKSAARNNKAGTKSERDTQILKSFSELREQIESIRAKASQSLDNDTLVDVGAALSDSQEQIASQETKRRQTMNDRAVEGANELIRLISLGEAPVVSQLIGRSQLELRLTLDSLADQCERAPRKFATLHSDWVYSIMAVLHDPIDADICSALRRVAKFCIAQRKVMDETRVCAADGRAMGSADARGDGMSSGTSIKSKRSRVDEEEYASTLLIICLVRHYFGQLDLK